MKIAILGAGAMGSLFGGYLSQHNEVWLVDIDKKKIDKIKGHGIIIREDNTELTAYPNAVADASCLSPVDLLIVFVKAMYSKSALSSNKHLIGSNTYVMTLQNGSGHEEILMEFVPEDRIIIGTTQHNSSMIEPGHIHHGGKGLTQIGLLKGDSNKLQYMADNFKSCGFDTIVSNNVKKHIWEKLLLNSSASVLTAILQVKLGYIINNPNAWNLAERLILEAVSVANAEGMGFDAEYELNRIKNVLMGAQNGYTSIYADLRDGMPTEVDTISGSVVRAGKRLGIPVPNHEFAVLLVHALEEIKSIRDI